MVVVDELVHNSVVMGIRSSRRVADDGGGEGDGGVSGRDGILRFRHNDVSHLRHVLRTNHIPPPSQLLLLVLQPCVIAPMV